jgi:tetratricopeptide (TPR) repeat protein
MNSGFWSVVRCVLLISLFVPGRVYAQLNQTGKIIGTIRVLRGDFPVHPVLVSLDMRGSTIASAYTDDQGRFGFPNLAANEYKVSVNDDAYEPALQTVEVDPANSSMNFVLITLTPRESKKKDDPSSRAAGSNPYLIDPADYYSRFPKKTRKEFDSGVEAEKGGKTDEAVAHYQKALSYSPDFALAHNHLGSIYLSKQNFDQAQSEFEAALKSNPNDAQTHFNLANVLLMTKRYDAASGEIDEGLKRQANSAFGQFLQGMLYYHTNRPELAEKSLRAALQYDPKMSQASLQLVNLYLLQKRTPEAIAELETYLKAFPDSPFSPQARDLLKRLQSASAAQ